MTINEYRYKSDVKYPTNGEGRQLPQLIDDIYEAREAICYIRKKTQYTIAQSEALCEAIGRLNRALSQLGIEL